MRNAISRHGTRYFLIYGPSYRWPFSLLPSPYRVSQSGSDPGQDIANPDFCWPLTATIPSCSWYDSSSTHILGVFCLRITFPGSFRLHQPSIIGMMGSRPVVFDIPYFTHVAIIWETGATNIEIPPRLLQYESLRFRFWEYLLIFIQWICPRIIYIVLEPLTCAVFASFCVGYEALLASTLEIHEHGRDTCQVKAGLITDVLAPWEFSSIFRIISLNAPKTLELANIGLHEVSRLSRRRWASLMATWAFFLGLGTNSSIMRRTARLGALVR